MKTKFNKQNRGFTIIEVMIVLGIAGLILAIVLLAVPALQRSQRNNARRSDSAHIAGLVSDYVSNHAGQMPPAGAFSVAGENFSQLTTAPTVVAGVAFGNLTAANININESCNPTNNTLGGQPGAFAVTFGIEGPGAPAAGNPICIPG